MFGFCIVEIHKGKIMLLLTFQAKCPNSSIDAKKINIISKSVKVQWIPLPDIRLARKRHMPNRNQKREHSLWRHIMDSRIILQMFNTKSTLFKVNNRNTRARCKTCLKLTIKAPEWHQWLCSGVPTINF